MAIKARHHGVQLRRTSCTKCAEAARYQDWGHFGGITVSTLAEAEFFAQQGFTDITYAVPISQGKVARACALAQSISQLHLLVDHPDLIPVLGAAAATVASSYPFLSKSIADIIVPASDPQTRDLYLWRGPFISIPI